MRFEENTFSWFYRKIWRMISTLGYFAMKHEYNMGLPVLDNDEAPRIIRVN